MSKDPSNNANAPMFNAPGIAVALALIILVTHGLRLMLPDAQQGGLFFEAALVPARLGAMLAGSADPGSYSVLSLIKALFGHAFLHGDWMHAGVNALMGLAVGAPVARAVSGGVGGLLRFGLVFFGAVVLGSIFYFALVPADGPPAVGASGGVSGLLAGALLTMQASGGKIFSRQFLMASLGFGLANLLLAFVGPSAFGFGIAWQAHLGGFVGGALLFQLLRQDRSTN